MATSRPLVCFKTGSDTFRFHFLLATCCPLFVSRWSSMRFGNIGGSQNLLQASTICIIACAGHSKRFGLSSFRGVCQTILGTDDAAFKMCATFQHCDLRPQRTVLLFRIGSCVARVANAQANAHPREREKDKNISHRGENVSSSPPKRNFRQFWPQEFLTPVRTRR